MPHAFRRLAGKDAGAPSAELSPNSRFRECFNFTDEFLISQCSQECDQRALVSSRQWNAAIRMLRQIWIERSVPLYAGAVVFDNFFQTRESAVVHIRAGHCNVAQRRNGK